MKKALVCTMLLGVVWSLPAAADWQFTGGIGVHPLSSITGCPTDGSPCLTDGDESKPAGKNPHNQPTPLTVNFNVVRGVHPAGQIWVINSLDIKVASDGTISGASVSTGGGKGLVLGGGNNAGRAPSGANAINVIATLICEAASPFTEHTSATGGVLLSPTGDFTFPAGAKLSPAPVATCASPMLLIRNAITPATSAFPNPWFAVGIYTP
jgi:hypothetical protein